MAININFFRSNSAGNIDYEKLLEFFDGIPNFKIYYTDDEVEILYIDAEFKFSYRYLITKKSRVNQIYKLSPLFTNVNFLLEMPVLIPTFLAREILGLTQKICKTFELEIYHDSFADVKPFNLVDTLALFSEMRETYIEEYGLQNKYPFDPEKLNEICKFQRTVDNLKEYYHGDVDVQYCEPIIDKAANEYGICTTWNLGIPTVFPPHVDYIRIRDEENFEFMIRRNDFYDVLGKYLVDIVNFLPDMHLLRPKQARSSKKAINKLRKFAIVDQNFKPIRLCDLIDR